MFDVKKKLVGLLTALILTVMMCAACGEEEIQLPQTEGSFQTATSFDYYEHWAVSGNKLVYGNIYVPKDFSKDKSYPTVIMSHGFTGSHEFWRPYIKYLTEAGCVCYAFDFCGGSVTSYSDGSFFDMSVMTEVSDLKSVVNDIKNKQKYFTPDKIYLFGESQGGLVTAITAPDVAKDIESIVLFYPAFSIPDNARTKYPVKDEIPDNPTMLWTTVGKRYIEDIYELDPYAKAAEYEGDVLIYHGDDDSIVDIKFSQKALERYGDNAELVTIEGGTHGFGNSLAADISEDIIARLFGEVK